ncbi:MAG: glycosyltransferase family 39 protein [Clostridia bacterium]|nr:glycosyltransferase family 39 protein [Clostridia bacterium]
MTNLWRKALKLLRENIGLMIIIAAGLTARLLFYFSIDGIITTSDSPTYVDAALGLYYHLWLSEYRPPFYPLALVLVGALFTWKSLNISIVVLQIIFSLINIIFVYKLAYEAFEKKTIACLACFLTAVSFRVFSWDFVLLTENLSILIITLITYTVVTYIKYRKRNTFKQLLLLLLAGIFTKPFFLFLPIAVFFIFLIRQSFYHEFEPKHMVKSISTGLAVIYFSVAAYSSVNYAENLFFGISSVGNVNILGKVLQYKMEDLGNNEMLKKDIQYAFNAETPEFKVNGQYLEPWHFIGTYGWARGHYKEVGRFAKEIILKNSTRYILESARLTYRLFVLNSPFKDYIADAAIKKAGHPNRLFMVLRTFTEGVNATYPLLSVCLLEFLLVFILGIRRRISEMHFFAGTLMIIILYHYIISAFLSYGDYCRLLAPCYPLIYTILSLYLVRILTRVHSSIKSFFNTTRKQS